MQIFNAIVRLQGSLANEVFKEGLTVPEILILRRIHGDDAVVKIESVGVDKHLDSEKEREYLAYTYGQGLAALADEQKTSVEKMFGGDYNPLPEKLRGFEGDLKKDAVMRKYDRDEILDEDFMGESKPKKEAVI